MSEVRWWVRDREKALATGKSNGFVRVEPTDILFKWSDKGVGRGGSKFIKVSVGRSHYLEFTLYHMEKFQKALKEHNPKEIIIYDRYDFVSTQLNIGSDTCEKMFKKLCKMYNITRKRHELNETYTLEEVNEILMEIDDLLTKYEEWELLDIMSL